MTNNCLVLQKPFVLKYKKYEKILKYLFICLTYDNFFFQFIYVY
jgi:hypothetical protein